MLPNSFIFGTPIDISSLCKHAHTLYALGYVYIQVFVCILKYLRFMLSKQLSETIQVKQISETT